MTDFCLSFVSSQAERSMRIFGLKHIYILSMIFENKSKWLTQVCTFVSVRWCWRKVKCVFLFSLSVNFVSCSFALCCGKWTGVGHLLPQEKEDVGLGAAVHQPGCGGLPLLCLLLPILHCVLVPSRVAGRKHHLHLLRTRLLHLRLVRHVHHHRHQHHPLPEDLLQSGSQWE